MTSICCDRSAVRSPEYDRLYEEIAFTFDHWSVQWTSIPTLSFEFCASVIFLIRDSRRKMDAPMVSEAKQGENLSLVILDLCVKLIEENITKAEPLFRHYVIGL